MIRVSEDNRADTADLFEKGGIYCLKTFDHANTKPVIFAERNIVLLLSGRAGSSFAMKWYLQQNGMESEHAWTHNHRTKVIYPSAWHDQRRQAVYSGEEFQMLRFCRNPFSRAVSSFLHSTQNAPVHKGIVKWLGHENGYSFLDFLNFIAHKGPRRVNNHYANQFSHLEEIHELDAYCQIESGIDGLNELEAKLGLPATSPDSYAVLKSSPHNLAYEVGGENVPERVFALGVRGIDYPTPDMFYDDRTEPMVREIYEKDFRRLGYSTDLPDLSPKSRPPKGDT